MTNQDNTPRIIDDRQVSVGQVNKAFDYLLEIKNRPKKRSEFLCIGRGHKTRKFLKDFKLPPLPLLRDNLDLRTSLKPREKSPLFRVAAAAIAAKARNLNEQIKEARKVLPSNNSILYRLEPPIRDEKAYDALSWQDYQTFANETLHS